MALETPWSRAKKTRSQRQEERLGRLEGGSEQVNSGRFWRWKRDVKLDNLLIEARTTEKGSYSITAQELRNIDRNAKQTPPGCIPAMQLDIQDLCWIALPFADFEAMRLYVKDLETVIERLSPRE